MRKLYLALALIALCALVIASDSFTRSQEYGEEWWNGSWHYRVKITVNTSSYNRTDWPVEYNANFTSLLGNMNVSGSFDPDSVRVVEVNDTGGFLQEIPSQFDQDTDYDPTSNAAGTVVFILNGTTPSQTLRNFYVYFDVQYYPKQPASYSSIIEKTWDGDEFRVYFNNQTVPTDDYYGYFTFDTQRGDNTSGLYQYLLKDTYRFTYSSSGQMTREYVQTTDGIDDYGYDLAGNASFSEGPARIRVRQEGYEIYFGQADNYTNLTYLVKNYYFYPNKTWFVIEHEIININDSSVTRGSYAGISGFDLLGAYGSGYKWLIDNSTDPGSWVSGSPNLGIDRGGYGHLWESGTTDFIAANYTAGTLNYDRIGINLSLTTILPGESISDRSVMAFYDTVNSPDLLTDTLSMLMDNVEIAEGEPEMWIVSLSPEPDHDIYNRNESAIIDVNVTRDDWGIVDQVNATFDMGTPGVPGDDLTIQLLDNGVFPDLYADDGHYTAYFNFTDSEVVGYWNLTSRSYDADGTFLNESYYTFNVTDVLDVNITIHEETGIYRVENATVLLMNYRKDIFIPGATEINCTSAGQQVPPQNVTDFGNGTYLVTFQTPFDYGLYPLNCSFGKDGSWGFKIANYTVEAPETNISIIPTPSSYQSYSVTFLGNESFDLNVRLQNTENSTAYSANITLDLPDNLASNSTFEQCGNILIDLSCIKDFNITILNNTAADNYSINITINWTNRILTTDSNTTSVIVTVHENPILDVAQDNMTGILPPGSSSQVIGSLLVMSTGNNDTLNVGFSAGGLDNFTIAFDPTDIPIMNPGEEQPVDVEVSVPQGQLPGIYDGWINVTSDNGGYKVINTTIIVTGTNLTINATPDNYTSNYVTAYENESFVFSVNVTNTGNTTAFNSYVDIDLPSGWYINATNHTCGNVTRGETCMSYFFMNITELTYSGTYYVNATIHWEDIGISWKSNQDNITVTVVSNVTLEVDEDQIERTMEHGTSVVLGNVTVRSIGNDNVTGINLTLGSAFDNFTIGINQTTPFDLFPGEVRTIRFNATIPPGFDPGYYNGYINISPSNSNPELVALNITVPQNGSWTLNTTYCEHSQSPNSGVACDVLINNTGNIQLNLSVYPPSGANHSFPEWPGFNLSKQNSTILTISYDMGGDAGQGFFNTNYTINTTESAADPDNYTIEIVLNPYVNPLVDVGITPDEQVQGGEVTIMVNATSQSGATFDVMNVTVQRPNGTNDTFSLTFDQQVFWLGCDPVVDSPGDKLCYQVSYPSDFNGDTAQKGNYTVFAYAEDTYNVNTTTAEQFNAYVRYMANVYMPDTSQGSWESIGYRATDYNGDPLPGASVNLSVKDPDNRTMYMLSGNEYTTGDDGWVSDNIFVIPAHATTGEYMVYSNGTYYDSSVDKWISNESQVTFNVTQDQDLIGKVTIPSPSYVDNTMAVSVITIRDFNTPIDPDWFNVTIYYTEGYSLQVWRQLDDSDFSRTSTGFYSYQETLGSVLTGSYLAVLEVHKGDSVTYDAQAFRIASGGPYDVFLDLVQSEVAPGDPLEFDITIWNKGEIDHLDVISDYWVYGEGQTWDSSSFSTNVLGGENKTFRRSVFIYSNQPPGFYNLNAEVTYDPNQPPATANVTFLVTGEEEPSDGGGGTTGEEGGGGGAGGSGGGGSINITSSPEEIGSMIGLPKIFNIKVQAVGGAVRNVWINLEGIPRDWYIIDPPNITQLSAGDTAIFSIQLTVPRGETGERQVRIVARTTESDDEEDMLLRIFTSRKDLINFELTRLKAKLAELRDRADRARESGFDTNQVDDLLDDAESEIKLAEGYLKEELYDPALDSIYTAWNKLDEAEALLDKMLAGFTLPWWVLLIIVFAFIIVGLMFLYRKISKNFRILMHGRMSEARQVAGTIKGVGLETEKLREEKAKTERMLTLLESQFKQGIISKEAYESLRNRSNQRIHDLEKKIMQSIKG